MPPSLIPVGNSVDTQSLRYPFDDLPPHGEARTIAPGIKWLQMPLPFALDHINLYLLEDGDGWVVVDTGIKGDRTQGYWRQIFERELDGKPVTRVIVTHMHPDHLGQAGWICREFGAPLLMSRTEYYYARTFSVENQTKLPPEAIAFYERGGVPDSILQEIIARGWGNFSANVEPVPVGYYRLVDGQVLMIGGRAWRVVTGSGHSPEHVCLYCDELDVLISGDQVLPRITSNVSVNANEPEEDPLSYWLASHRKFLDLPDTAFVLPSHNRPFYGLHARLRYLLDHHEDRMLACEEKCTEPQTAFDLLPVMFSRELDSFQTMLALGECMAHLHCLMNMGRLDRFLHEDGRYRYRSIDPSLSDRAHPDRHEGPDPAPLMV
jgi:glyoxylase-like metal-dependent hydrolase (beta-lactamase superfamily II)